MYKKSVINNDQVVAIDEELSYFHSVKAEGRKEKIVLQTCINDDLNYMVFAEMNKS